MLPVEDSYVALPAKSKATFKWAIEHGYDFLFHADDDTYVQPDRLLSSGFDGHDYVGRLRGSSGGYPAPYCSGFAYWLSRRAMEIIVAQPLTSDTADDRWLGNVLHNSGITGRLDERYRVTKCDEALVAGNKGNSREDCMVGNALHAGGIAGTQDNRYVIVASPNGANTPFSAEGPREGNDIIAACEFEPPAMFRVHQQWLGTPAAPVKPLPQGRLSNVCIVIKTFLRDGFLLQCIAGIQKTLPECKMVIVDDGDADSSPISREKNLLYERLRRSGHVCHWLPKDSGFGAKSNAAIRFCDRPYVLIGSDDFNFSDPYVRSGIERMVSVLSGAPDIGIASGRVNNRSYEMTLELGEDWARARDGYHARGEVNGISYQLCDLTINYSLIRREVFEKVRWDEPEPKIGGGEHGAFFWDIKTKTNWKVCVVSGANIREMAGTVPGNHPAYAEKRMRAKDPARPCYERRGIKHFLTSSGCEMCGPSCELHA